MEQLDNLFWTDDWMLGGMRMMRDGLVIREGTKDIKGTQNQGRWKGEDQNDKRRSGDVKAIAIPSLCFEVR